MRRMRLDRYRSWLPWAGVAILAAIQVWALPGDYLGREHDDAHYVLAARSMLRGEYRLGISPGNPPLTFIPPGWPLLLTPAAAFSGDNPLGYHLTAWFFLVACDAFMWLWLRRRLEPGRAAWAVAFFGLNPLVLYRAGKVMTEIPALALMLSIFVAIDGEWPAWACGAMLGFAWLVRQRATALIAAVWFWYASRRRWRDLAASAAAPVAAMAAWSLWLHHARGGMPELDEWAAAYAAPRDFFAAIAANLDFYVRLWGRVWLCWLPASAFAERICGLALGTLAAWGLARLLRRRGFEPALGWLVLGGAMHAVWPWQYDRYLIPFIPMLLWCLIEAVAAFDLRPWIEHAAFAAVLAGLLLGQDVAVLSGKYFVQRPELERTYEWIRASLPIQAALASPFFSRDALYTGRPFAPLPADPTPSGFVRDLRRERVGYVLFEEYADVGLSLGPRAAHSQRLRHVRDLLAQPAFRRVYADPAERTEVFVLLP